MEKYKSLESIIRQIAEAGIVSTPGAINTGHVRSGRNTFSSQKNDGETGHSNNNAAAMKRVADQEKETKKEQQISKDEMQRQIDQRNKDAEDREAEIQKRVKEEAEVSIGTKARIKIKQVSRQADPEPTSPESKLARTAAYKQLRVDEENPMNNDRFGLPSSLISAVQQVIESNPDHISNATLDAKKMVGGKTKVDLEPKTLDKLDDESGSKPSKKNVKEELSPAQKKIAGMAADKKKIDAADFKALRSGKCSECGKKPCGCMHEESEVVNELSKKTLGSYIKRASADAKGRGYDAGAADWGSGEAPRSWPGDSMDKKAHSRLKGVSKAVDKLTKEESVLTDEELENIAAIAELFDEGKKKEKTVPSQTTIGSSPIRGANQDQSGFNDKNNTADYTISDEVQYESKDLELDEGRGRPRKNPKPEEPSEDEHEHPVVQLQKIISTQGTKPFTHLNGEKTTMNPQMAHHALKIYHHQLKTASDKDAFTDQLHKSHASMKAALS